MNGTQARELAKKYAILLNKHPVSIPRQKKSLLDEIEIGHIYYGQHGTATPFTVVAYELAPEESGLVEGWQTYKFYYAYVRTVVFGLAGIKTKEVNVKLSGFDVIIETNSWIKIEVNTFMNWFDENPLNIKK